MKRILSAICTVTLTLFLTSCGGPSKGLAARGKIMRAGKSITLEDKQVLTVTFVPEVASTELPESSKDRPQLYAAVVDGKSGNFTVQSSEGEGIAPGKYRVVVELRQIIVDPVKHDRGYKDLLNGQFSSSNTPLLVQIDSSNYRKIMIDLDQTAKK